MPHEKKEKVKKPKAKMVKIQIKKPIRKKAEKKTEIFTPIPQVDLNTDNITPDDIEKFKTSEIKLDDIRAALEFNFNTTESVADETDAPAETEQAAPEINETAEEIETKEEN